jgi:hypothetical protein
MRLTAEPPFRCWRNRNYFTPNFITTTIRPKETRNHDMVQRRH